MNPTSVETITKEMDQIHANIDSLIAKFDRGQNQKALENEMAKEFKKIRQLASTVNPKDPNAQALKKKVSEKEEMSKYLVELKKGLHKPESRAQNIERLKKSIKDINDRCQGIMKMQKEKEKNPKKKGNNNEKNIEFLKNQLNKLEKLKELLESGSLFSVDSMNRLYTNYIDDIFTSMGDNIFQDETQQLYQSMFTLAGLKAPDPPAPQPVVTVVAVRPKEKEQLQPQKREFRQMMSLSFQNIPRWNDYRPSDETKEKLQRKSLLPQYRMIDLSVINKMSSQTLFFMFYYQKCTMEQYFSAKQLKNRTWRYHIRYTTWFRRYEAPMVETPEYEKGNYMYFDFQKFWQIRKKSEFIMRYHQMQESI